ncbi:MAG TPA: polyprenyl synthetase family protein [Candidatus Hydrogenedentes bacterium]|nr:polyprenyl synthetase family protein [Candidatus Hydrogenedentota bacterium]
MGFSRKRRAMTEAEFESYLGERKGLIDTALERLLLSEAAAPARLLEAMRCAALDGGKRLRPILSLAVADIAGRPLAHLLDVACAIELIRAASLVLDDLPAMDDAAMRRNHPSLHVRFGESTALLAAIALLALAYERIPYSAECCGRPASAGKAVQIVAHATGAQGIVSGQFDDLAFSQTGASDARIAEAYRHKSGDLFCAAALAPAQLAGLSPSEANCLDRYASNVGLAFQITDDLIDADKTGEDAGKITLIASLGMSGAREHAARLLEEAVQALDGFGDAAEPLRFLARTILRRTE